MNFGDGFGLIGLGLRLIDECRICMNKHLASTYLLLSMNPIVDVQVIIVFAPILRHQRT
jgi:hypothetical protein